MDLTTVFGYVVVFLFGVVAGRVWRGSGERGGQMLMQRVDLTRRPAGVTNRPARRTPPDADLIAEVRSLTAAGNFIHAIKVYRDQTGAGLKESKEAVEAIMAGRVR
jgi:hypothetical protein